jgi:general secretion pathway protein D
MLNRLDVEPAQVFLDCKFVSTANTDLLDLGIDYGDTGPQASISLGSVPITVPFGLGGDDWEDPIIAIGDHEGPFTDPLLNGSGGTIAPATIFGALDFTQVQATLKMLQRDTNTNVIQAPKIIALDGAEATIFVGETIRYAEAKSEQGQAGGLQLSLQEASSSPVDVGFQLMIVPHVIPGTNSLTLDVIPKETSLSGTGTSALAPEGFDVFTIGAAGLEGSIALPRTRSSTIVTSMLLESGQSAVIGGLTTESETETKSRVPFVSRIPVVGELFKYRTHDDSTRNLIVFITPSVVHSSAEVEMLLQRELDRREGRLREEIDAMIDPARKGKRGEG